MKRERRTRKALVVIAALAALILPAAVNAGSLDPAAAPAPTMRTLEELKPAWNRIIPGAARFVDALAPDAGGNYAAVLDKETGLVWAKSPSQSWTSWQDAKNRCTNLVLGGRMGWRLPTLEELSSLVDHTQGNVCLPSGHPFSNVQGAYYWSSSTGGGYDDSDTSVAGVVEMWTGHVDSHDKSESHYVWRVRSGQ